MCAHFALYSAQISVFVQFACFDKRWTECIQCFEEQQRVVYRCTGVGFTLTIFDRKNCQQHGKVATHCPNAVFFSLHGCRRSAWCVYSSCLLMGCLGSRASFCHQNALCVVVKFGTPFMTSSKVNASQVVWCINSFLLNVVMHVAVNVSAAEQEGSVAADSAAADALACADWGAAELVTWWWHESVSCFKFCLCLLCLCRWWKF